MSTPVDAPARSAQRSRRGVGRSVVLNQLLFGVIVLVVLCLQQLVSPVTAHAPAFLGGIGLTIVASGLAVGVPWQRFARAWTIALPVMDILAIALLRYAAPTLGAGLLWVFPVIWLSSSFGTIGAIASVAGVVVLIVGNALVAADPISLLTLPAFVVIPLVLSFVGASSALSARRSQARRALLSAQSRTLESAMIRARREENLLADVLDAVDFGVARVDASGRISVANEAHERLLRATGTVLSTPDAQANGDEDTTLYAEDGVTPLAPEEAPLARALRGEEFSGLIVWAGPPGRGIALSVTAGRPRSTPGQSDEGTVLVYRDVTAELQAIRARDDLVASISHELRTPLTSIVGYLDLAMDEDLGPTATRHLEVAERNASRLLGLVTDILAASAARDQPVQLTLDPRPTDLAEVVAASVESLAPRAAIERVHLDAGGIRPCPAVVDAFRMRQVLDNLLSNAIKYNRPGGSVTVGCGTDADGSAVIEVADTGTGIAAEEMPQLFDRFFRSESVRGSSIHGSGLGLGISRDIVRRHGGELIIDSVLGSGTTAVVRLPPPAPEEEP